MRNPNQQQAEDGGYVDHEAENLDMQISDLAPERRSHYLLLRLIALKEQGQALAKARAVGILQAVVSRPGSHTETDEQQDALEISDLAPERRSHYLLLQLVALKARLSATLPALLHPRGQRRLPLTRTQQRLRIGRLLTVLGLCASLALLLIGNNPDLRAHLLTLLQPPTPPTPVGFASLAPIGSGVPIIVERHTLSEGQTQSTPGPLPAICPQASMVQPFMTPLDPPGLGDDPIWITGFVGPTAALVDLQPLGTSLSHPQGQRVGWYEELSVFIQRNFSGTITLRGESQEPGSLIFFAGQNVLEFSSAFELDLSSLRLNSMPGGSQWQVTAVNVIVPFAGCYGLQVSWPTGSWSRYFAAGS